GVVGVPPLGVPPPLPEAALSDAPTAAKPAPPTFGLKPVCAISRGTVIVPPLAPAPTAAIAISGAAPGGGTHFARAAVLLSHVAMNAPICPTHSPIMAALRSCGAALNLSIHGPTMSSRCR